MLNQKNEKNLNNINKKDIENAKTNSLPPPLINRLTLTPQSIEGLIKSIEIIKSLPDPIGKILAEWTQPNGLKFQSKFGWTLVSKFIVIGFKIIASSFSF